MTQNDDMVAKGKTELLERMCETETRWTAFEGEYPVAHAEARYMAERIAKQRGFQPTHYVLCKKAYPFTHLKTVREGGQW